MAIDPDVIDLAYVALLALAWPAWEYFVGWPAFQRRLRADAAAARRRAYLGTIVCQWLIVAIGAAIWLRAGREWSALALAPPRGWRLAASIAFLILLGGGYASQALKVAGREAARSAVRKAVGKLEAILPHSRIELAWFLAASVTAGVCEELLFRACFVWTLAPWLGWWGAAALSAGTFGLLHAYQGKRGIVRTAIVGAAMSLVVAGTRSLLPAIALHVLIDVGSGVVTWLALREGAPAGS